MGSNQSGTASEADKIAYLVMLRRTFLFPFSMFPSRIKTLYASKTRNVEESLIVICTNQMLPQCYSSELNNFSSTPIKDRKWTIETRKLCGKCKRHHRYAECWDAEYVYIEGQGRGGVRKEVALSLKLENTLEY